MVIRPIRKANNIKTETIIPTEPAVKAGQTFTIFCTPDYYYWKGLVYTLI